MSDSSYIPDSGDLIWLDINARTGHEQSGRRPCLVLSDRLYAERTGMTVVCPITSKVKGLPFEVALKGTKIAGAILSIHIRSINLEARCPKFIESTSPEVLRRVRNYVTVIIGAGEA
jgi:mRNA interferase MazF